MRRHHLLTTAAALAAVSSLATACSDDDSEAADAASSPAPSEASTGTTSDQNLPAGVTALPDKDAGADFATLAAGRYRIRLGDSLAFDVDVPDKSYAHDDGLFVASGPVVLKTEVAGDDFGVSADACTSHEIVPAGPSAADLVQALSSLEPFRVSKPETVTLGGAQGTYLEATLPASYDAGKCQGGGVQLPGTSETAVDGPAPYLGRWWVLDVDGQRVMVQQGCWECTRADLDAVAAIPESITFSSTG